MKSLIGIVFLSLVLFSCKKENNDCMTCSHTVRYDESIEKNSSYTEIVCALSETRKVQFDPTTGVTWDYKIGTSTQRYYSSGDSLTAILNCTE